MSTEAKGQQTDNSVQTDKIVTDVHEVKITETVIHQETEAVGNAGTVFPSADRQLGLGSQTERAVLRTTEGKKIEKTEHIFLLGTNGKPLFNTIEKDQNARGALMREHAAEKKAKAKENERKKIEQAPIIAAKEAKERKENLSIFTQQLLERISQIKRDEEAVEIWMSAKNKVIELQTANNEAADAWISAEIARESAEAQAVEKTALLKSTETEMKVLENQVTKRDEALITSQKETLIEKDARIAAENALTSAEIKIKNLETKTKATENSVFVDDQPDITEILETYDYETPKKIFQEAVEEIEARRNTKFEYKDKNTSKGGESNMTAENEIKVKKGNGWKLPVSILGAGLLIGGGILGARAIDGKQKIEQPAPISTPKTSEAAGTPNITPNVTVNVTEAAKPAETIVINQPAVKVTEPNKTAVIYDDRTGKPWKYGFPCPTETSAPTPEIADGIWAETAYAAAWEFGTDDYSRNPANWEKTAQGNGWHMKENGQKHNLNLRGFVAEGYWDTVPGSNPQAVVAMCGSIDVQGATIWDVRGERAAQVLYNKKGQYQWPDGTIHTPQAIGFYPNASVGYNQ
jgi:hypothetical protein